MAPITETQHREEARRIVGSISFLLPDAEVWRSRVEATIALALATAHQSGRDEGLEEAAKAAEADGNATECPYGTDKPGDPTWYHTDEDTCPVCHQNGADDGSKCRGLARNRIATAIRSLKTNAIAQRAAEGGGEQNDSTAALDNPESNHTVPEGLVVEAVVERGEVERSKGKP